MLGAEDRGEVVKFAHAAIDAGADLVVGYGPHLPRAMEFYKGKLIDYALGNFVTYGPFNLKGPNGLTLILLAKFDKKGTLLEARAVPFVRAEAGHPGGRIRRTRRWSTCGSCRRRTSRRATRTSTAEAW